MATEKIDLNNLDKSDWKTYRFDEIAQNISERVDPNNTDLEVYIGLEHIDSESLHIKRHGTPDDVNGTKLKFYKDDIIFGRRRAYQRKAGIATCDGFCSAHALVLRANPDVIDPALFPFFMHSDLFMNKAVDISVGSLSPTINWGTLKGQNFLLPPKLIQSDISDLLSSINCYVENLIDIKIKIEEVFELIRSTTFTPQYKQRRECVYGNRECIDLPLNNYMSEKTLNGLYKSKKYQGSGIRIIHMGELFALPIITNQEMSLLQLTDSEKAQFILLEGDLIFSRTSLVVEGAGKCSIIGKHDSPMTFESNMIRVRLDNSQILPKYAFHFFNSSEGRRRIRRIVGFTAAAAIASSDLIKVKVPKVDKDEQFRIVMLLDRFEKRIEKIQSSINAAESLRKTIISRVF